MLDPRDHAFLSLAVARGVLAEARARELAGRYRGIPGGLGSALVEIGAISREARDRVEVELASSDLRSPPGATPGSGRLGQAWRPQAPPPPHAAGAHLRLSPEPAADSTPTLASDADSAPTVHTDEVIRPPVHESSSSVLESDGPVQQPPHPPGGTVLGAILGPRVRIPGYELEAELGRGGMGVVYRARRLKTGETVAIKLLLEVSPRHRQRFKREAAALERLDHVNIIKVLETGETPDGQPYLVMPYMAGGDLRVAFLHGAIDARTALGVVAKVARAIAHAHSQQVLHRDLKPGNILLDLDLEPRVTDFGLAKILDHESNLTRTGVALGTPQYMAPEQVRCAEPGPPADVHALGVILFQVLTGELPYPGSGAALFQAITNDPPPRPWERKRTIRRDLGRLVLAALEKEPGDRPTCAQLADAIDAHLEGRAVRVRVPSRARQVRRAVALVLGVVAGGAALGAGLAWAAAGGPPRPDAEVVAAAADALDVALRQAERARGPDGSTQRGPSPAGVGLDALLREVDAHRVAAAHLARARDEGPPGLFHALEPRYAASGARARRLEVLAEVVPLLLARGDVAQARRAARERLDLEPDAPSHVLLARALAADPATCAEASRVAQLAADALPARADPALVEQVVGQAAETLLAVHRPALATRVLDARAPLSPALGLVRTRALLAAGDPGPARSALAAALAGAPRDPWLVAALAEVEVRLGRAAEALALLDGARAGSDARWHAARAGALLAQGDVAQARRAWDEAVGLEAARAAGRGRHHLRRGRPAQALQDLERGDAPAARLDAALAQWTLGGPDERALRALAGVLEAARACGATPGVGAAAARWLARLEVARERAGAARRWAALAWDLDPGPASAAVLAWALLRDERPGAAQEALDALRRTAGRSVEGKALEAQLLLALGRPDEAEALLAALPERLPERADLAQALAQRAGRAADAGAAAALAFSLRRAPFTDPAGRPCPVPVASDESETPLRDLVDRLLVEARRAQAEPARCALLLRRVAALDPGHVPARLVLAQQQGDLAALSRLASGHAALPDVRRARLQAALAAGDVPPGDLREDLALLRGPDLPVEHRHKAALLLAAANHVEDAWSVLQAALAEPPRRPALLRDAARLARARNDGATADQLEAFAREAEETRAREAAVREDARVDDKRLVEGRDALALWARDLDHDAEYHLKVAFYETHCIRPSRSLLAGAEFLRVARAIPAWRASYWTHSFGYVKEAPEESPLQVFEREVARRPEDGAPFAARALYLLARLHSPDAKPGDAEAAADAALRAVDLEPDSPGFLALAADALVEAGDAADAAVLARRALALDDRSHYAALQQARVAARSGDVDVAIRIARHLGRVDAYGYSFQKDPCFAQVRQDERFKAFLAGR